MRQLLAKASYGCGWGGSGTSMPFDGSASWASFVGQPGFARVPISAPGTFKNLVVRAPTDYQTHPAFSITVLKNGVATALTASLLGSDPSASDLVHSFTVVAGDDFGYNQLGASTGFPGFDVFPSFEFDADDPNVSIYGIGSCQGSRAIGGGFAGGAFGNGVLNLATRAQLVSGANTNTYSIASSPGNITRLDLISYRSAILGATVITGYIVLNHVVQDGSGGTVDTSVVLTGSSTKAFSTFTLPITVTDHVEIFLEVTASILTFDLDGQIAAGIAFESSNSGEFMICGGYNDDISNAGINYRWLASPPTYHGGPEGRSQVLIGPLGLNTLGLYVEYSTAPGTVGTPQGWTSTLRQNGVDTTTTFDVTGSTKAGQITNEVDFVSGDLINIGFNPISTPNLTQAHWGLALSISEPPTPPPDTISGPLSGIYFLSPGKTNDTIYQTILLNTTTGAITATTEVVAIPNPYIYTAMLGDE